GRPGPARTRPVDGGHGNRRRATPVHRNHRPPRRPRPARDLPVALGAGRHLLLRPRPARPPPPHSRHRTRIRRPSPKRRPAHPIPPSAPASLPARAASPLPPARLTAISLSHKTQLSRG